MLLEVVRDPVEPLDRVPVARLVVDRALLDRALLDRALLERALLERALLERGVVERLAVERPLAERLLVARPVRFEREPLDDPPALVDREVRVLRRLEPPLELDPDPPLLACGI